MSKPSKTESGAAKFTLGPWEVSQLQPCYVITHGDLEPICSIAEFSSDGEIEHLFPDNKPLEAKANINLISAAPEMYESLRKICHEAESWHSLHGHEKGSTQCDSICKLIPEMRAALARARGERG